MKYWEMIKAWRKLWLFLKIKRAIHKANKLHIKTGRTHYVVKYNNNISIIDKAWFKYMRQHGKIPRHITAADLRKISIYYTR